MELFWTPELVRKARDKARKNTRILTAAAVCALILFVILCLMTRTGNARLMLAAAMISMVLAGWCILAFWLFAAEPSRAEARHLEGLSETGREIREGRITLDPAGFRIPKSVRVLKVKLETEEETLSLNLNEKYRKRVPPDGSYVRVQTARKFITGLETLETAPGASLRKQPPGRKRILKALGRFFPGAVIWILLAVILTGFVFTRITDTDPAHKITIYADCRVEHAAELAEKLEKELSGAVRMVKVHPFTFALFGTEQLKSADLYIVPDLRKAEYADWLEEGEGWVMADPDTGLSVAGKYFQYNETEEKPSVYRMYCGGKSVHLEDGLARRTAELLMRAGTGEE